MAWADLIKRQTPVTGVSARHDRRHRFKITRQKDDQGFHVYTLENRAKSERLLIPRFLFDRFRSTLRTVMATIADNPREPIEIKIDFKGKNYFEVRWDNPSDDVMIRDLIEVPGHPARFLTVSPAALDTLDELCYDGRLQHPNDVLNRIVAYHKLFQFTFTEGSESITSDLALRKDVLAHVVPYVPALGKRLGTIRPTDGERSGDDQDLDRKGPQDTEAPVENEGLFKSRLAERHSAKDYQVDYEALFGGRNAAKAANPEEVKKKKKKSRPRDAFPLPMVASDLKRLDKLPFKCEFSKEDITLLRDQFLKDRDTELFVGFEMMDAVHRTPGGSLRSFRFPLYYMRVQLKESGRFVFLEPADDGRIYLNHLALANLVEQFGRPPGDPVDQFFQTLLAQRIEVSGKLSRIYLSRHLPHAEEVFDRTRDVLLGFPGENGKGGLLGKLKLLGIEADLESVYLYKTPKVSSPITAALEADLDRIQEIAHEKPERFYASLLGRFLSPDVRRQDQTEKFAPSPYIPGAVPPSTRRLLCKLDAHDLVLLEGPPGTGKTFSIMNLFIHCLCTGKRLMVVSDQKAAIHALTEKLQEYLMGKDRESSAAQNMEYLWRTAVKVVDEVPAPTAPLAAWLRDLRDMLGVDNPKEVGWPPATAELEANVDEIDADIASRRRKIQTIMEARLGPDSDFRRRVTPKRLHATTVDDINALVSFLRFMGNGNSDSDEYRSRNYRIRSLIQRFIRNREFMAAKDWQPVYEALPVPTPIDQQDVARLSNLQSLLETLVKKKPKSLAAFERLVGGSKVQDDEIIGFLWQEFEERFPPASNGLVKGLRWAWALIRHPLGRMLRDLTKVVEAQKSLLKLGNHVDEGVWRQLQTIHEALHPKRRKDVPLSLEICRFTTDMTFSSKERELAQNLPAIQELLEEIGDLQKRRDDFIRQRFLSRLGEIADGVFRSDDQGGTNKITKIASLISAMKGATNIEESAGALQDLQTALTDAFPIWICRKQAVPFLFPCVEKSFDLIIVDEATQCRVDDALPLLFRAKKLMTVGDEKQTVLAKNSVIDDYLFREFNLSEHLRSTQAHGIKGGGSHIFGLVKAIKQASVMLDEHYRCPPDIIEFSNRYVYGGELRTMQWTPKGKKASVVVDYSEQQQASAGRRDSGKYKGLETDMVDRYLEFVAKKIKEIEKETGDRISVDTDVALCYFLLKNEPYIKDKKAEFLQKLGRGNDILDGAGAALQGKERDYIFYLWDVSRSNFMAFRQGDDPDKRKGELNVLMSRPKKRAYHFIHRNFQQLDHRRASITDYLWSTFNRQESRAAVEAGQFVPRKQRPGPEFIPWRRSSGSLMGAIIDEVIEQHGEKATTQALDSFQRQSSVTVGDPRQKVDLMLIDKRLGAGGQSVGLVDLCGFECTDRTAQDIIDYYFQLQRATPKIKPVFLFMHEIADDRARAFHALKQALAQARAKNAPRRAS